MAAEAGVPGAACSASSPGVDVGTVVSLPSIAMPVATISVWLSVTRIWLTELVGQLAKNAGVVKKPGRGVASTSSVAARSVGRS